MNFNKTFFSLLAIVIMTGCKREKKVISETKSFDTISIKKSMTKDSDSLTKITNLPAVDTTAVLLAFKKASKTNIFGKELEFNYDDDLSGSIFDSERPILIGDLNGDHLEDAIMPFTIEGRDGGNNWDAHYAIFINKNGELQYKYSFNRGGDLAETQIFFKSIQNGVVHGMQEPGFHFSDGESSPVRFIYKNNRLSEFTSSKTR